RVGAKGGDGKELNGEYRESFGSTVRCSGRGEMVPNDDTFCESDPNVVDMYGSPGLRFHFRFTEYEYRQAKHMQDTFREIIHELDGTPLSPMPPREAGYGLENGGRIIHEVGTTRMGADPARSVVNPFCQAHDVKNLFITDG